MTRPTADLDHQEIQSILFNGFGWLPTSVALLLEITDPAAFRAALRASVGEIVGGPFPKGRARPASALQVGLSYAGLAALNLEREVLAGFSEEFRSGMNDPVRSRVLGDTGDSHPDRWEWGNLSQPPIHTLLLLYGANAEALRSRENEILARFAPSSRLIASEYMALRPGGREPFGFRDGLSQPTFEPTPSPEERTNDILPAGEFILGYPNAYGQVVAGPFVSADDDPKGLLPPAAGATTVRDFGRNGSYLVLRKLHQDVAGFEAFLAKHATNADGRPDPAKQDWLAAKLIGRHRSGAPLVLAPEREDSRLGLDPKRNNDFGYAADDAQGLRCPHGAHIRRCNPRDSLDKDPRRAREEADRHRLLRRGRAYGSRASGSEGLIFIVLNADLRRQFEFVQQTWLNNPKFAGLRESRDPLAGNHGGDGTVVIPQAGIRRRISGIPGFVTTRGGAFFFLPSLPALRYLARE
jgi:Dyp-type peroxidase family